MIHVNSIRDLDRFGITALTGEADALSLRILCDLSFAGAITFREAMGLPSDCPLAENWNSRGVASAMIPHELVPLLAVVALHRDPEIHKILICESGGVHGLEKGDDFKSGDWWYAKPDGEIYPLCVDVSAMPTEEYCASKAVKITPDTYRYDGSDWHTWYGDKIRRVITKKNSHPHVGTRNVHAMSGRVA